MNKLSKHKLMWYIFWIFMFIYVTVSIVQITNAYKYNQRNKTTVRVASIEKGKWVHTKLANGDSIGYYTPSAEELIEQERLYPNSTKMQLCTDERLDKGKAFNYEPEPSCYNSNKWKTCWGVDLDSRGLTYWHLEGDSLVVDSVGTHNAVRLDEKYRKPVNKTDTTAHYYYAIGRPPKPDSIKSMSINGGSEFFSVSTNIASMKWNRPDSVVYPITFLANNGSTAKVILYWNTKTQIGMIVNIKDWIFWGRNDTLFFKSIAKDSSIAVTP